jgi:hypothetical protein
VVDKVALGQVFSEYFGFPCQFLFHRLLHTHLSSGDGTIGQLVADVPSGLSLTPPHEIKKKIVQDAYQIRHEFEFMKRKFEYKIEYLRIRAPTLTWLAQLIIYVHMCRNYVSLPDITISFLPGNKILYAILLQDRNTVSPNSTLRLLAPNGWKKL